MHQSCKLVYPDDRGMLRMDEVRNSVLCLYEFEVFDHTTYDVNALHRTLFDNPGLRLVYAEEIV